MMVERAVKVHTHSMNPENTYLQPVILGGYRRLLYRASQAVQRREFTEGVS